MFDLTLYLLKGLHPLALGFDLQQCQEPSRFIKAKHNAVPSAKQIKIAKSSDRFPVDSSHPFVFFIIQMKILLLEIYCTYTSFIINATIFMETDAQIVQKQS